MAAESEIAFKDEPQCTGRLSAFVWIPAIVGYEMGLNRCGPQTQSQPNEGYEDMTQIFEASVCESEVDPCNPNFQCH